MGINPIRWLTMTAYSGFIYNINKIANFLLVDIPFYVFTYDKNKQSMN